MNVARGGAAMRRVRGSHTFVRCHDQPMTAPTTPIPATYACGAALRLHGWWRLEAHAAAPPPADGVLAAVREETRTVIGVAVTSVHFHPL